MGKSSASRAIGPLLCGFVFSGALSASAQTYQWNGAMSGSGDYQWSIAGNWVGGIAPAFGGSSTAQLIFDGTPAIARATNDLGSFTLNQMTFDTNAGNYIIAGDIGDEVLHFASNSGVTPSLVQNSSSDISLVHDAEFLNGLNISGTGSGAVELSGNIKGRGVLAKSGPSMLTLDSPTSDLQLDSLQVTGGTLNITDRTSIRTDPNTFSSINGGATVNINTGGSLTALLTSSGPGFRSATVNVETGGTFTTIGDGRNISIGSSASPLSLLVDGTGSQWTHTVTNPVNRLALQGNQTTVTIRNGGQFTTGGTLRISSQAVMTVDGGTASAGSLESSDDTGILKLSDNSSGVSALTLTQENFDSGVGAFNGTITDAAGGPGSITVTGGNQYLYGLNNTYSGGTRLNGGLLHVLANGSLGTGGLSFDGGGLIFDATGTLDASRPLSVGPGGITLGAVAGQALTVNNTLTLSSPLTIEGGGFTLLTGANQYNGINLSYGTLQLTNDADATVSGALTGNGGTLLKNGTGTLTLMKASTGLVGNTIVINNGVVRLTDKDALKTQNVTLNKNNGLLFALGSTPTTVELASLTGTGNLDLGIHSLLVTVNTTETNYGGLINGSGSVTFDGAATLTGNNSYTGGTFVKSGPLTLNASKTVGDIALVSGGLAPRLVLDQPTDGVYGGSIRQLNVTKTGTGKLTLTNTDQQINDLNIAEGSIAMVADTNGDFVHNQIFSLHLHQGTEFQAGSDGKIYAEFVGSSTLDTNGHHVESPSFVAAHDATTTVTKTGAGVWSINNGTASGITVEQGELELVGTGNPIAIGNLTLHSGSLLTGAATMTGLVPFNSTSFLDNTITLNSGATIAPGVPGASINTLGGTQLIWDDGGTLHFDLAQDGSSDQLMLTGSLTKGTTGAQGYLFDFSSANPINNGFYQLITFGSTDFQANDFRYTGFQPGASGTFERQGNTLFFRASVVPEISSLYLIGSLVVFFPLLRKHRRFRRIA